MDSYFGSNLQYILRIDLFVDIACPYKKIKALNRFFLHLSYTIIRNTLWQRASDSFNMVQYTNETNLLYPGSHQSVKITHKGITFPIHENKFTLKVILKMIFFLSIPIKFRILHKDIVLFFMNSKQYSLFKLMIFHFFTP